MTLRYSLLLSVWVDPPAEHRASANPITLPRALFIHHASSLGSFLFIVFVYSSYHTTHTTKAEPRAQEQPRRVRGQTIIVHIIQPTPRKLSPEHKNSPDAKAAGAWPNEQRMRRRRRLGRRRYQEVLLLERLFVEPIDFYYTAEMVEARLTQSHPSFYLFRVDAIKHG